MISRPKLPTRRGIDADHIAIAASVQHNIIVDDQSRPDISAALARKLVDQGVVFIMSISLSPATQQQQTVTMEAKTPQMTPMNSADYLTTQLQNPYFWQTGPLGSTQGATLLAHARAKNFKRVALLP